MTLLDDEYAHVREVISSLATQLNCTNLPVMSQKARDLLVEYFVRVMINLDSLMCVVCLVAWSLGTAKSDCDDAVSEVRTVFNAEYYQVKIIQVIFFLFLQISQKLFKSISNYW
jgi:hypothetical protein